MSELAVLGGKPIRTKLWPTWPVWDEREEKGIMEVLHTGIDEETGNLNPDDVEKRITPSTKAIMPIHMAGLPVAERLSDETGVWIFHRCLLGNESDTRDIVDALAKVREHAHRL